MKNEEEANTKEFDGGEVALERELHLSFRGSS